jgi:hypothetical protein
MAVGLGAKVWDISSDDNRWVLDTARDRFSITGRHEEHIMLHYEVLDPELHSTCSVLLGGTESGSHIAMEDRKKKRDDVWKHGCTAIVIEVLINNKVMNINDKLTPNGIGGPVDLACFDSDNFVTCAGMETIARAYANVRNCLNQDCPGKPNLHQVTKNFKTYALKHVGFLECKELVENCKSILIGNNWCAECSMVANNEIETLKRMTYLPNACDSRWDGGVHENM